MAGLLDTFFGNADQTQALGLLGAGLMNHNASGGIQAAMSLLGNAPDKAMDRKYRQAQFDNLQSEMKSRDISQSNQQDLMNFIKGKMSGQVSQQSALPGQSAGGVPGVGVPSQGGGGFSAGQQSGDWVKNLTPGELAFLKINKIDLGDIYKMANEGFERKPNTFYVTPGGETTYTPDPTKFIDYKEGRVVPMNGAVDTQTALTLATEAPKALLGAAGRINLRDNPDGTKSPISELAENPTLQNILGNLFPGQGGMPQRGVRSPSAGMPPPLPQAEPSTGNFKGDPTQVAAAIAMISDPQQRANAQAAFDSQMRSTGGQLPVMPQGIGYGKTTAQVTQEGAASKFAENSAAKQAEMLDKSGESARTAADSLLGIQQSRKAMQAGAFQGTGADAKLGIAKFINANVPGLTIDPEKVANTDYLKSTLGAGLLQEAKTLGSNPSNADANRITDIVGSIGKDPQAMGKILDWRQEMAKRSIGQHNSRVDQAEGSGYKAAFDMRVKNPLDDDGSPAAPKAQPAGRVVDALPTANPSNKGRFATDTASGKRFQSNGMQWVEVK